jgi:hypothetical protein
MEYQSKKEMSIVSELLEADPSPEGIHFQWLMDQYLDGHFHLEDVTEVREYILKFKELFGDRRPLPKKGYLEMKVMIKDKLGKEEKKLMETTPKTKVVVSFSNCKSYFKNIKNTLPERYKKLPPLELEELFHRIQDANPTDNFQNCIWIVEEIKKGNIREEDLPEVRKYLGKYFKMKEGLPLPNFYPSFPVTSNYQLVKDTVDKNVNLLFTGKLTTGEEGTLLIPLTTESACYYGAQTSWCTARPIVKNNPIIKRISEGERGEDDSRDKERDEEREEEQDEDADWTTENKFYRYFRDGNIYIWFDKNLKDKFQFQFEKLEFKDRDNEDISKERFKYLRNHSVLNIIFDEGIEKILKKLDLSNIIGNFKYKFYPELKLKITLQEYENLDLDDKIIVWSDYPEYPLPDKETILNLKDPYPAIIYADLILKSRWPELEEKVSRLSIYAFHYAKNVIKGRWKEAENENGVLRLGGIAEQYAMEILKKRWPNEILSNGENLREKAEKLMFDSGYGNEYRKRFLPR